MTWNLLSGSQCWLSVLLLLLQAVCSSALRYCLGATILLRAPMSVINARSFLIHSCAKYTRTLVSSLVFYSVSYFIINIRPILIKPKFNEVLDISFRFNVHVSGIIFLHQTTTEFHIDLPLNIDCFYKVCQPWISISS